MGLETINLFDFGLNENNEYVNLVEEQKEKDRANHKEYPFEEIIKGHELEDDFVVCATFHTGCLSQWGYTLEQIQAEIKKEVDSKCYHFGNLEKGIYAYSYKIVTDDNESMYWFCIENEKHIVVIRHTGKIDDLLYGREKICYPACCVYIFEVTENGAKEIRGGYGNGKEDIRYKVLCDEFKILEFSSNRIDENKNPKDFYEAEYEFSDFCRYWKQSQNEEEVDEEP